jgi:hypothetical protein
MLVGLILAGIAVGGCAVWQASQPLMGSGMHDAGKNPMKDCRN